MAKEKEARAKRLVRLEQSGLSLRNIVGGQRTRRTRKDVNYRYDDKWEHDEIVY